MKHYVPKRTYETTVILQPNLNDLEVEEQVNAIKALIEEHADEILTVDLWGRRRLAYPIRRFQEGVYVFFQYHSDPSVLPELNRYFRITENVIRHLTVRVEGKLEDQISRLQDAPPREDRRRDGRPDSSRPGRSGDGPSDRPGPDDGGRREAESSEASESSPRSEA